MGENTAISWADFTFNGWVGCTKISPACDGCYAEAYDRRYGGEHWGPGKPRRRTTEANWNKVRRWNFAAPAFYVEHRRWPRVFGMSLADWLDAEIPDEWLRDFLGLVEECKNLRWMLLTKRIGRAKKVLPKDWGSRFPHVGIMATVENQEVADRDVPKLLELKAEFGVAWVGLSMEPLLERVDLTRLRGEATWRDALGGRLHTGPAILCDEPRLDWVITGGETDQGGFKARVTPRGAFKLVVDQCAAANVPFHHKQNGEWLTFSAGSPCLRFDGKRHFARVDGREYGEHMIQFLTPDGAYAPDADWAVKVGKRRAGRLLDGCEHNGFPEALRC